MKLLLDTHILLWVLFDRGPLSPGTIDYISDPHNQIYCSTVSFWEAAIKHEKHAESFPFDPRMLADLCDDAAFGNLPVSRQHVLALASLSLRENAPRHKDPFDRMLIAQAKVEGALLLTHDKRLAEYDEACVRLV